MTVARLAKIFVFSFLLAVSTASAQSDPQAMKFDEFEVTDFRFYSSYGEITVAQRAERFAKQLEKQRGAKAYIIYYKARITNEFYGIRYLADRIKQDVLGKTHEYDDVVIVDGGFRENAAFEFWIAPENAAPPKSSPTFAKSETFFCPEIIVVNENLYRQTETIVFSIPSYYLKDIQNYTLKWQVSAGEIVEGQGKDFIKVKLNDSAQKRVTAFLEVGGLPLPCRKIFSTTAEISGKLFLLDSFGQIANGDTKQRLDYFLSELQKNPMAKGYVIVYGNRTLGGRSVESRISLYKNHFTFRNFDLTRISIVRGGYREETSGELWLSFDDAEKPVPTPTVDKEFVEIPKPARRSRPRKK
ncbi:MAG: hypothetical protein M3Q99_15310 [Acidobacteriota bacterium]|nr:hypothetical protein [Acidobacteriota bacterium]